MPSVGRYLRRALPAAAAFVFAVVCAAPARAQTDSDGRWHNGVTEAWWFAPDIEPGASGAAARWEAIGEAARTTSGHAWAGDYFSGGSTHGTYMRWSPGGGFVMANVNKCAALVMGLSYGRAEVTPTLVRFVPEFHVRAQGHGHSHGGEQRPAPAEIRFVPVEWEGQRLLVHESNMGDFGDYLAGLGRYNDFGVFHFLDYTEFLTQFAPPEGERGHEPVPSGSRGVVVPPGYGRFLKRPIEGVVTAVGKSRDVREYTDEGPRGATTYQHARLTYVTVNLGTEHGVTAGMVLRVSEPAEGDEVRVVSAGKRSSTGVVVRSISEDGPAASDEGEGERHAPSPVRVGWRLTTSPF